MPEPLFDPITGEAYTDFELDGCPKCALLKIDWATAEADVVRLRRVNAGLRATLARVQEESGETKVARALYRYWVVRCGKDEVRTKFGEKRQKAVKARLRDGYSPEFIARAIDWVAEHGYVNEQGRKFDDLELVCRDETKLEGYYEQAVAHDVPTLIGPAWRREFGSDIADA